MLRFTRGAAAAAALALAAHAASAQSPEGLGMSETPFLPSARVVMEEEWAKQLVQLLGLEDGLPAEQATPEDLYGLLCPEQALRGLGEEGTGIGGVVAHPTAPDAAGDPVRVVIEVPATALYLVQVEGTGLQRWSVDRRLIGHLDATPLGVAQAPKLLALRAGPHEFMGVMGADARADRVELSAHRQLCVAPADGWRTGRPLSYGARARTSVRALGLERYLPDEGTVAELEGERFDSASRWDARTDEARGGSARSEWARAGDSPAEFHYRVRLPQPGLVTLEARVSGGGPQLWSVDGRLRSRVDASGLFRRFGWQHVMTTYLAAGEHVVRALVPAGAAIDRIRLVARASTDPDYVEVLEQMGMREDHVHALVTRGEHDASLRDPAFLELATGFLERAAGGEPPLPAIPRSLARLYPRPLGPVLPSDL
jgi:hypothetical protein